MEYYSFVDQMTFIDSGSTDKSLSILEEFADRYNGFVRICQTGITWWDHNKLHEYRNHIWRDSKSDLVLFPDCDEIFYHPSGLKNFLEKSQNELFHLEGFEMVSDRFPKKLFDVNTGYPMYIYNKATIFDPKIDIYFPNAHLVCSPTVNVSLGQIKLLHYRYLGIEHMRFRRDREAARLPKKCSYRHIATNEEINKILKNAIDSSYVII